MLNYLTLYCIFLIQDIRLYAIISAMIKLYLTRSDMKQLMQKGNVKSGYDQILSSIKKNISINTKFDRLMTPFTYYFLCVFIGNEHIFLQFSSVQLLLLTLCTGFFSSVFFSKLHISQLFEFALMISIVARLSSLRIHYFGNNLPLSCFSSFFNVFIH